MRPDVFSPVRKFAILGLLCLMAASVSFGVPVPPEEITNSRVIEMTELGLGDDIIIAKFKTAQCKFILSDRDLLALKQAGVSDKVVAAMLEANVLTSPRVWVDGQPLELHTLAQAKVGGRLGRALTVGIKSAKTKAYLQGPTATLSAGRKPKIAVELPPSDSLDNYILVRLDGKDDRRELEVAATGGIVGSKSGIRAESIIATSSTALGPNRFQLQPTIPLERGEYILYVVGSADSLKGVYGKGYDFSVD